MRTLEQVTSHSSTTAITQSWDNANNGGVTWFMEDAPASSAVGGTAALYIVDDSGNSFSVQTDAIASATGTVIVYDFPIAKAQFVYTPSNTNAGVLTSRLTPKPVR